MKIKQFLPILITIFISLFLYKLLNTGLISTLIYITISYYYNYDSNIPLIINNNNEIEDNIFIHSFIKLNHTYTGEYVNVTYHIVECGNKNNEPIVFGHGLCENWRVWKNIMKEFCSTHRVIAYDSEGMGQSYWPNVLNDLPEGRSRRFMADMQLEMLRRIGVHRFNLVITDYSFWSTLSMIHEFGLDPVLRYAKLQSTVGVEDIDRIPQGKMMKIMPQTMDWLFNLNRGALARVIFSRPLISWLPNIKENGRNYVEISEKDFQEIILSGLREKGLTAWVYFYNRGPDLTIQMATQIKTFQEARYPVLMMQGRKDKGQPPELFDGTAKLEFIEAPVTGIQEKLIRVNLTHKTRTTYSPDGVTPIGPKAEDFFPNSPWVKFKFLDNVGHFIHLEAPNELIAGLKELLAVPLLPDRVFIPPSN